MSERPGRREAIDRLARDLVDYSRRSTAGTSKRPETMEQARQRARRAMLRAEQRFEKP